MHEINGVKYFEYVLGSDDFNARVAKSKFSKMPNFAKANSGYIALQGDHGSVSFRNIKIRPLPAGIELPAGLIITLNPEFLRRPQTSPAAEGKKTV